MVNCSIIVIGSSAGGVQALTELVRFLPEDFPGSIFIVHHISPGYKSHLAEILTAKGKLPAISPEDGEAIKPGIIYVARENRHLLVKQDHVMVPFGPRENRLRPSIDALFRSAAAYQTSRVVAVLLTGYLDDGVSGLAAVKRCGGITIVQDPQEAEVPDLPNNAITSMEVDHVLPISAIAAKLVEIVHQPAGEPLPVPEEIIMDVKVSEHTVPGGLRSMHNVGEITPYTCPDCGGSMWEVKDEPMGRLMCHTGHSFTMSSFLTSQSEVIENSLWEVIRFIQERMKVIERLAEKDRENGREDSAWNYLKKNEELNYHVRILREFIVSGGLAMKN